MVQQQVKDYAELLIAMSTDVILGKIDKSTYLSNLKAFTANIEDLISERKQAEEIVGKMIEEKIASGEYVRKKVEMKDEHGNVSHVTIVDKAKGNESTLLSLRDPQEIRDKIDWFEKAVTSCNNKLEEAIEAAQNAKTSNERAHHLESAAGWQIEMGKGNLSILNLKWALGE